MCDRVKGKRKPCYKAGRYIEDLANLRVSLELLCVLRAHQSLDWMAERYLIVIFEQVSALHP